MRYAYFDSGEGADATGDAFCLPVSSFRSINCAADDVILYFEPLSDTVANSAKIILSVADGKQIEVAKAIAKAFATSTERVIVVADDDTGEYLHSDITACEDASFIDA